MTWEVPTWPLSEVFSNILLLYGPAFHWKNNSDLERVRKAAVWVIMGNNYSSYKNGLKDLKLDTLERRRDFLCLIFAKNCLNSENMKDLFPLNKTKHHMKKRKQFKFLLKKIKTKRWKNISIATNDKNVKWWKWTEK